MFFGAFTFTDLIFWCFHHSEYNTVSTLALFACAYPMSYEGTNHPIPISKARQDTPRLIPGTKNTYLLP